MKPRRAIPINSEMPPEADRPSLQKQGQLSDNEAETGTPADPQPQPSSQHERDDQPHAFHFSAWLLEGLAGLSKELQHTHLGLPEAFWTHAYAARRETLLAVRALVDAALARCETQKPAQNRPKQRGQVQIDFD